MRKFWILSLACLVAGCGGSGGGSGPGGGSYGAVSTNSPFQGSWAGYWWDGRAYQDDLMITVRQDGTVTGEVDDPFIPTSAAVTGNVRDDGSLAATYQFEGRDRVTLSGTVTLRTGEELVGTLRARQSGATTDIQIVLERQ